MAALRKLAAGIIDWERGRADAVTRRAGRKSAPRKPLVGASGVTLSGYADRVDLLPAGMADIWITRRVVALEGRRRTRCFRRNWRSKARC